MRKFFVMQARQSGKTNKAMYEFMKDPEGTLYVTPTMEMATIVRQILNPPTNNIISIHQMRERIIGRRYHTVILDEYLFFDDLESTYQNVKMINPETLLIFTTSKTQYPYLLYQFILKWKTKKSLKEVKNIFKKKDESILKMVSELWWNFLTDEDTILIDTDFLSIKSKSMLELKNTMGTERFEVEILNQYFDIHSDNRNINI